MSADVGIVLGSLLDPYDADASPSDHIFASHLTADHGLALDGGGALVFEDGLTVTGDLVLTHAASVTFKGRVEVTGKLIIDADEIDFLGGAGSVDVAGDLSIQAHTAGLATQVGFTADSLGSLGITDADLAALRVGGKVAIGDAKSGAVVVDSAEFHNDVSIAGSNVTIEQTLLASGVHVALTADGIVRNDGLIDVSASGAGAHAGTIILTGKYAGNFGTILARGSDAAAGGSVTMTSTFQTLVSSAGVIDASGGTSGGTIKLWSDHNTTMSGKLLARGGQAGGNGGFVEVSSAGGFSLTGHVDTTAMSGRTGTLLLDPKNVIVSGAGAGTLAGVDQFSDTPGTDVTINASTITGAAAAVTIQANNDITVDAALSMSQDLTLQAGRSVIINQNIALANKTLTIIANDDAGVDADRDTGAGSIATVAGVTLSTGSGTINLTVENGDAGAAGGITIDKVATTGTLNIRTAGFVHETAGDAAPAAGAMTSEDDLTAGILNLVVTATDATVGEALDQGNGALEVAAGVINADVQLPGGAPASDFTGYFVLTDADHTNGSAGGATPSTMNAPMTIGTFNAGSGSVILTSKGGSILGTAGATPNITAMQVNLTAGQIAGPDVDTNVFSPTFGQPLSHYGAIGSVGSPLRTDVAMITATATDGGVFISEANSVMINSILAQDRGVTPQTGANGVVVIQPQGQGAVDGTSDAVISAGGDVVVLDLKVADQLTLTATGMIADGNQDSSNILARGLTINTGGAFGDASDMIETTVMTLQAATTNGGVFISETDGLNVSSITAGGSGNDVTLTSGAGAVVLGAITAAGGDVTVKAAFDTILDGNGAAANITAGTATLEGRTGLGTAGDALDVNAGGLSTKVTNSAAATHVSNAGTTTALSIETNNGAVGITLTGGSVAFVQPGLSNQLSLAAPGISTFSFSNTGGSVALKSIDAGAGSVSVTARTFISDFASDTVLNLKGGATTLKAGTYIGTQANAIETNIDSLTASADAGGIFISDSGAINSLTATAKGSGNDISVSTVGDLFVAKAVAPNAVALTAGGAGNIRRIGNVLNISGTSATLHAGGAIGTSAEPLLLDVRTLASAIADNGGNFLRARGAMTATTVRATGGDIEMASEQDMTLGLAETDSAHLVKLTSTYGAILDDNAAAVNVRGGAANLTAVRIGATLDAIDTDIDTLTALGTSGGVFISELGDVTVTRIEAQGLGSNVSFTAGGNITLGVAKADGDNVTIKSIAGSISDGNGSALNITADSLDISAPGGIGALQNAVNRLGSADGGVTGVTISNIGALAITDATLEGRGAGRLTIDADSITILDIADNVASLDLNGSLQLTSRTGNIVFLDPADTIAASGAGSIIISAGLGQTPAYPNTGAVAIIGNLTTAGGAIDVEANHHITIGLLDTGGGGNVTVASETGVILDGNGAAANIIGNVVTLSGAAMTARAAQLETSIRIADYSAIRSEAASKLTNAQSLSTATAIMSVQKDNALGARDDASAAQDQAQQESDSADTAALAAYITATALDGVATALGIARDIVAIPSGAAQAIPLTGDGGAMTGYSALDVAANVADVAAYAAGIVADQLGDVAEEKANALVQASAEFTALSATYEDSLATWKAFDEATSVAQKSADAAAIARDHALVVRDQAIFAEDQVNVIGTGANPLGIQAHQLNATATDGSVYLAVTGDLDLGGISATGSAGVVSVAATGDIYVSGTTTAPGQVSLGAGGSIIDAGGSIEAPKFLGLAQNNIGTVASPIHTITSTFAAHAATGTLGITNTGALEIGSIDGTDGVTAAGSAGVTTSGSLTFKNELSATGQTVTLLSQTGAIIDAHTGSADVSALTLNATAASGITFDTAITNLTANVTGAGSIEVREADGITLSSVQAANGAISVEAAGTIVAGSVVSQTDADTNDIFLKATAGGGIQAGTVNAGATAGDVTLDAGGGISMLVGGHVTSDALVAKAGSGINLATTAKSADAQVTGAGDLTIDELDALAVSHLTTANGMVSLTTGGAVTLAEGAVSAAGGASDVTIHAGGAITGPLAGNGSADIVGAIVQLVTAGAAGTLGASIANPLEINTTQRLDAQTQDSSAFIDDLAGGLLVGTVDTGLGNLYLKALSGGITAANSGNGVADIVAAHVDLKVTGAASTIGTGEGSELDLNGSTLTLSTEGGSVFLADTAGGIAINTLNAGTGDLFLTAAGGAITDNDGGPADNITANRLMLSATAGAGTDANPIEASVSNFEGSGGTGGVNLTNLSSGLVVGGVTSANSGVSATGGNVIIRTPNSLTIDEAIANTGGGNVTLTAIDSADTGDDLTVNADITATGGSGNVTLLAGDHFTLATGTTISAPGGTVDIHGDNGDADSGVGSTIALNGAIRANRLQVTSGSDDDTLTVADAIVTSQSINTGDGDDEITITAGNTLGTGTLNAGDGDNAVTVSSAVETLLTGDGKDTVNAYAQVTTLNTGAGDDDVTTTDTVGTLLTGDGNDTVHASGQVTSLDTGIGDDDVTTTDTVGTLLAGDGNDTVHASGQVTSLDTGIGDDDVTTTDTVGTLLTGDGRDAIHAFGTVTTLNAGDGDDTIDISAAVGTFDAGKGNDLLLIKAGGSITTSADGGEGSDKFIYDHDGAGGDDFAGPVTVNLQTRTGTGVASFDGFERFEATTHSNDHLIGADTANAWHVASANAGDIGGAGTFDFTGFENLTGGAQDDTFQFATGTGIAGNLDGGTAGHDTIDYNGANFGAAATVVLDGSNGGTATTIGGRIDRIDEVIADADFAAANSLTGGGANNVWNITGPNSGNISHQFYFQNFGITGGGTADDNFVFADGALPPKPVHGGPGSNTLDLSAWTSNIQWNITGDGAGTVTTTAGTFAFTGMTKLIGGSGNDRFTFADDTILGGGLLSPGAIEGNGGADFIDISAYTPANKWTRTNTDGTIETGRGAWSYSSIEQYLGSKTTTFLFDVIDLTGTFTSVSMPAQLFPTQGGNVTLKITNIGNDDALNKFVDVSYYLSLDGKVDAGDVLIGKAEDRYLYLLPGDSTGAFATAAKVPFGTTPGSYHLLAEVDSADEISEGDETNNVVDGGTIQVLPIQVDLSAALTKSTLPAQALPGDKGALTAVVTNLGNSPAKGKVDVEFFMSQDGTIDAGDIALGGIYDTTLSLAGGASRAFTLKAQIPAGTPVDDYQVLVRVDGKNNILEFDENNNTAAAATSVHVNQPFVDITGQFQNTTLPNLAIPNDVLKLKVPVTNLGNAPTSGKIGVNFYLSVDGTVDPSTDVLIKSLDNVSINLAPNGQQTITTSAAVPATVLNGTYYVLADIDPAHMLAESNQSNNTAVLSDGLEVVWRFGSFGDRRNVHLIVPDANGNMVNFSINGVGVGNVIGGSDFTEIALVGTNEDSSVIMAGRGPAAIHAITSTNSILQLVAPKVHLLGDLSINGSANSITLGDVSGQSEITLGASADPDASVALKFGRVANANLASGTPIRSLAVADWLDNDSSPDLIQAPWIGSIKSGGNFEADILATGMKAGVSLSSMTVKGVAKSDVTLAGGALAIKTGGWDGGTFDATFARNFVVNGSMQNAQLTLSGLGVAADDQALGTLKVTGRVDNSLIDVRQNAGSVKAGTWGAGSVLAVSVDDGGDGTFFDGNEASLGGTLGQFTSTAYDTVNGGHAFGIAIDGLLKPSQLSRTTIFNATSAPLVDGDLHVTVV